MRVTLWRVSLVKMKVTLPEKCAVCEMPTADEGNLKAHGVSGPSVFAPARAELELGHVVSDDAGTDYDNCVDHPTDLFCDGCGTLVATAAVASLERMGLDQQEFDALVLKKAEELIAARRKG